MSYALGEALQGAVYQRLAGDSGLALLVGDAIYDALPTGPVPGLYVLIGAEDVVDRSDVSGHGALHRFRVSVVTDADGYGRAKAVAAAVSDALQDAELVLSRGRMEVFVERPVSATFLALTLLILLASIPQVRAVFGLLVRGRRAPAINE